MKSTRSQKKATSNKRPNASFPTPVLVPLSKMIKDMKQENPAKFRYKFTVDCVDKANCLKIQKYMKAHGFEVKRENTSFGDHYGLKKFGTLSLAKKSMTMISDKFSKFQMNAITLEPVIIGDP